METDMKNCFVRDEIYGLPCHKIEEHDEFFLFLPQHLARANAILTALSGLEVVTAIALLKQCEQTVQTAKFVF